MQQINSFEEYQNAYNKSIENPAKFWAEVAENFTWHKKWHTVLSADFTTPKIEWFKGGECNLSQNCLDRHLAERGNQVAIIWEPNEPNQASISITYKELHQQVCKLANVLVSKGIKKGDCVCIYLPMIPQAAVAMLACARIGAIHTVVFAGFSATSLADRINDCSCKLLITADGVFRGDKKVELKLIADQAMELSPSIENCIVFNNRDIPVAIKQGRDSWWADDMASASMQHEAEPMDAESPLFILYTSGSTGKPKGILHTTAGYMVYSAYTFVNVFNYKDKEVFFCTADVGWVTGHTYLIYGPLLAGATTLMFEGMPTYPDHGRLWDIVAKHKVNILYTAPTAIRSLQLFGETIFDSKDLTSLRVLGSVGEPINEEAWHWYSHHVGNDNCPLVDTWWQTETGGILISPIATVTPLIPTYATLPLPGIVPVLMNEKGEEIQGNNLEGNLCIKQPWPGMARSIYGDPERFKQTYFSAYPGYYFTGDGCRRNEEAYYRITGRVDDVINVSGHRVGTGEIEDVMDEHPLVIETAVVGYPHDIKGQAIYAYIITTGKVEQPEILVAELKKLVADKIGSFARPDKIQIVTGLPKTRSGKIMRRILRKIAEGDLSNVGDLSTLLDPSVVELIKNGALQ